MQEDRKGKKGMWIVVGVVVALAVAAAVVFSQMAEPFADPSPGGENRVETHPPDREEPQQGLGEITEIQEEGNKVTRYMETPVTSDLEPAAEVVRTVERAWREQDWRTVERYMYRTDTEAPLPEGYAERMFGQPGGHENKFFDVGEPVAVEDFATEYKNLNRSADPADSSKVEQVRMKFKQAVAVPVMYNRNQKLSMTYYAVQVAPGDWRLLYDRLEDRFVTAPLD